MARSRNEFTSKTKREAYARSGGKFKLCGLKFDDKHKPEYDHIIMDALSGDNSLANCQVLCSACHKEKTSKHDVPAAAKTKRLSDQKIGIKHKNSLKRGKAKPSGTVTKALPPRRSLYARIEP